jgi:hypothetical protein
MERKGSLLRSQQQSHILCETIFIIWHHQQNYNININNKISKQLTAKS